MIKKHMKLLSIVMSLVLFVGLFANYRPAKAGTSLDDEYILDFDEIMEKDEVIYTLDENNTDVQGIVYTLNQGDYTASVANGCNINNNKVIIPKKVIRDDVTYIVNHIEDEAFRTSSVRFLDIYCSYLTIGKSAFRESQIEFIDLSEVKYVDTYAFDSCYNLKSIYTGEAFNCGASVFNNCTSMKAYYFTSWYSYNRGYKNSSYISNNASLETVMYDVGMQLEWDSIQSSKKIKNAFLPEDLKVIPTNFLANCKEIKKIYIPEYVEEISSGFLANCSTVIYGYSGSVAESYAAENGFEFVSVDSHKHDFEHTEFYEDDYVRISADYCEECAYARNKKSELVNPREIKLYPYVLDDNNTDWQGIHYDGISDLNNRASISSFNGFRGINNKNIYVPNTVTKNDKEYVVDYVNIPNYLGGVGKRIIIGDNCKKISCSSTNDIKSLHIGKSVSEIDLGSLNCTNLREITVDDENEKFKTIDGVLLNKNGNRLLLYPSRNKNIIGYKNYYTVPESVNLIADYAFVSAILKKIILPANVASIGEMTFAESAINDINLENVKNIKQKAFYNSLIKSVKLNNDVIFYNNSFSESKIEALYVKGTVLDSNKTSITYPNLKTLVLDADADYSNFRFSDAKNLEYVLLPEDIESIPDGFGKNSTFKNKLYVPATIQQIGEGAFASSSLTICGYAGSAIETYADENEIEFVDITGHEHNLVDFTFYEDKNYSITGKYCEECGYSSDYSMQRISEDENIPAETLKPTATPTIKPTAKPTSIPTQTPTVSPTETPKPTKEPTAAPTKESTEKPMEEPTQEPTEKPTEEPTREPTKTPTDEPAAEPTVEPTVAPDVTPTEMPHKQVEPIEIGKLKVTTNNNKTVVLNWDKSDNVTTYEIYRSTKKKGKYTQIASVDSSANTYVDKKVKPLVNYFYKIRAVNTTSINVVSSEFSNICKIKVTGLKNPVIKAYSSKDSDGDKYVTIKLKKYSGKYVELYFKKNNRYIKIKLLSNNIKKYSGTFKLRYAGNNKKIWVKAKTYTLNKKKKVYSLFSKETAVKIK